MSGFFEFLLEKVTCVEGLISLSVLDVSNHRQSSLGLQQNCLIMDV